MNPRRGILNGLNTGSSVFEWADKGEWKCRKDEDEDIDSRKFRIGFEPLFVDFTDRGAVYIVFMLIKWFVFSVVAGEWVD